MTYSEFLNTFFSGMTQCTRWLKVLFTGGGEGSPLFTEHLIFTIMAMSVFLLLIEEILGLISSFRFGGFIIRRFSSNYRSGYKVIYDNEYPKPYEVDYSTDKIIKPFKSGYRGKYFIKYNGKYYPFTHSRYNPFYARQFNSAYKSGFIVSASQIYGQKLGGGFNSSIGSSNLGGSAGYNSIHGVKGMTFSEKIGNKLGNILGKFGKKAYETGRDLNDLMNGEHEPHTSSAFFDDNFGEEPSIGDVLYNAYSKVDRSGEPYSPPESDEEVQGTPVPEIRSFPRDSRLDISMDDDD